MDDVTYWIDVTYSGENTEAVVLCGTVISCEVVHDLVVVFIWKVNITKGNAFECRMAG